MDPMSLIGELCIRLRCRVLAKYRRATEDAIAAGCNYSLALVGNSPVFVLTGPAWNNNLFHVSLQSQNGTTYNLEYKNALSDSTWTALPSIAGNGSTLVLSDSSASGPKRFYRVHAQ